MSDETYRWVMDQPSMAADRIEELEAENRRLKAALENTRHNIKYATPKAVCDGFCAKHECVCLPRG